MWRDAAPLFENVRDERYLRVSSPLTWRDATEGEIEMGISINAEAILDERLWLRKFLRTQFGEQVICSGRMERIDTPKLEATYGLIGSIGRRERRFVHAYLFDERGSLLSQIGRRRNENESFLRKLRYGTAYIDESVYVAISRIQTGGWKPFFLLVVDKNSSDEVSFTLSRPPRGYTLVDWVEKERQEARKAIMAEEATIDRM